MWLVVGLGNPGPKYAGNRHNVGFKVVELLASRWHAGLAKEKFSGLWTKGTFAGEEAVLLQPMTYMNLSGESVQKAMTFFKVPLANVIVIHDELDIAFPEVRLKMGGGAAGHNGLKSIIQHCGGPDFLRVRIGISRPPKGTVESWVLGDFDALERAQLPDVLQAAALASEAVLREGPAKAQNQFNTKPKLPKPEPKPPS
jgi:PTH1 family peptidyl-tRNA hydrolase